MTPTSRKIALFAVVAVLAGGGSYGIAQALPVSGTGGGGFGGPGGGRSGGGFPGGRGGFGGARRGTPPAAFGQTPGVAAAPLTGGAPGTTR